MDAPTPSPPRDVGLRTSLLRHLGAALAVVVLAAGLFGAVGQLRADPDEQVAAGSGTSDPDTGAESEPSEPGEPDDVATTASPSPSPTPDEATPTETASPEPTETSEPERDPSTILVQVLDGVGDGETAELVAQQLRDEGFDVVAINPAAVDYDVTTAFWTQDSREAAEQVADVMGYAAVDEQPGMLSEEVDVHVVAGADQQD